MFLHRDTHTDSLALKMLFRESAMPAIACAVVLLLITAAYCIRLISLLTSFKLL